MADLMLFQRALLSPGYGRARRPAAPACFRPARVRAAEQAWAVAACRWVAAARAAAAWAARYWACRSSTTATAASMPIPGYTRS